MTDANPSCDLWMKFPMGLRLVEFLSNETTEPPIAVEKVDALGIFGWPWPEESGFWHDCGRGQHRFYQRGSEHSRCCYCGTPEPKPIARHKNVKPITKPIADRTLDADVGVPRYIPWAGCARPTISDDYRQRMLALQKRAELKVIAEAGL